ncbi:DUF5335 family protein [Myxococcaceae bacterium GXIMD 01537]
MHHTREIPREGWFDYLSRVASSERDHLVRIEADSSDLGDQPVTERLPLVDIAFDKKGSDAGAIEVTVGRPGEQITHRILKPDRVYADEGDDGELECLDIEDSEHTKTLIFFEPESRGASEVRH